MNSRIKAVRTSLSLSQDEFANSLRLSRNFIWLIEKGDRTPSDRTIADICNKYNVNEEWLRNGTGEMFKPVSTNEQVSAMLKDVIHPDGSERWKQARQTIIESLAAMPPEFWEQAAELVDEIVKKAQKKGEA